MDLIHLLPDTVANQIAAGEVIQRPASVIKELVENAVDAGATEIHVIVVDAGRTSIQVIDNGHGMSETDARMAFERHATSKIQKADDLFALHTMGFRGEALPSVAAVAQVELTTRVADEEIGTRLFIAASKVISQEPTSCPVGSRFKVENLFYNVPARRKFLKSNATELNNIITAFERIVLVYPDVAFSLHSGDSELMNLRRGTLLQRITDVFGRHFSQDLMPVEVETTMGKVSGFVGKPEVAKKKGAHQYFFVNGRYMKHPYFHKAVLTAYERIVPEGMQPPYFLYFDVSAADIDVNIHPTKMEIKFENEQTIWQILAAAVKDAIGRFCDIPTIDFDTEGRPDIPPFNPDRDDIAAPRVTYNKSYSPFFPATPAAASSSASAPSTASPDFPLSPDFPDFPVSPDSPVSPTSPLSASQPSLFAEKSPVHYQYKARYIMTAVKSGLMVIDQYRASVRILYEQYLAKTTDRPMASQSLLFPEVVQFSSAESVLLAEALPLLNEMGFDLSDLGGGSYAVNAVPVDADGDPVALVQTLMADISEKTASPLVSRHERLALSLARATAVPYGQLLTNEEMDSLTNQLFSCSNVNYTPDGRPILSILPQSDIDQLFA